MSAGAAQLTTSLVSEIALMVGAAGASGADASVDVVPEPGIDHPLVPLAFVALT